MTIKRAFALFISITPQMTSLSNAGYLIHEMKIVR